MNIILLLLFLLLIAITLIYLIRVVRDYIACPYDIPSVRDIDFGGLSRSELRRSYLSAVKEDRRQERIRKRRYIHNGF